jgi:hypothetical protein
MPLGPEAQRQVTEPVVEEVLHDRAAYQPYQDRLLVALVLME